MALLQFLVIAVFIYFIFRISIRYLLPYLLKRFVNKKMNEFTRAQQEYAPNDNTQNGEVTIENSKRKRKKQPYIDNQEGEYVDYEEVD